MGKEYIVINESGVKPGSDWNQLVAQQRDSIRNHSDQKSSTAAKLGDLGAFIGAISAVNTHAGMLDFAADRCVKVTEPPMSREEEQAFREGVMSQYSVAMSFEMLSKEGN